MRIACTLLGAIINLFLLLAAIVLFGGIEPLFRDPVVPAFLALATCFCVAEALAARHQRPVGEACQSRRDRRTLWIAGGMGLSILGLFWIALIERTTGAGWRLDGLHVAGGFVMWGGIGLRLAAIQTLRRFFVTEMIVRRGQPLVDWGVYRFVRHPSETGLLAIVCGASLLLGSVAGLLGCAILILPLVIWRVRSEDSVLEGAFGADFRRYASRVKALVPLVY